MVTGKSLSTQVDLPESDFSDEFDFKEETLPYLPYIIATKECYNPIHTMVWADIRLTIYSRREWLREGFHQEHYRQRCG